MSHLPRRPVALLCILLLVGSLTTCHVRAPQQPEQVRQRSAEGRTTERIVGVVTTDGRDVRFDRGMAAYVQNDTIVGRVRGQTAAFALSDVQRVWVERTDPARTALAVIGGVVVGVGIGFAIVLATKESCPFVYSWDGEKFVFDAEPYGGAITRGLERDDYAELEHLRPDADGFYRLLITNEVNESQYTNRVRLLVVDHSPSTRVEFDEWGRAHALGTVQPPASARDQDGRDLLPWLRATDRAIWEPPPAPDATGGVRQEIVLTWAKPRGAASARLVTNAATGLWGSHMIREMLQLRGAGVWEWYAAVDTGRTAHDSLMAWNVREELYVLKVHVEEPDGWQLRGILPGGGPFIAEHRVVPLDASRVAGDSLRIRVRPPLGFWALNSFGVSYGGGGAIAVDTLLPLSARTADGRDILADLTAADDRYYDMPNTGDRGYLTFRAPPARPGMARTIFLHTRGYYRLHLPARGTPDIATLRRITEVPDAAARLAAERFAEQRRTRAAR